jgi:hypothetical protein
MDILMLQEAGDNLRVWKKGYENFIHHDARDSSLSLQMLISNHLKPR